MIIPILLHVEIEAASPGLAAVGLTRLARALFACIAHFAALVMANPPKKNNRAKIRVI